MERVVCQQLDPLQFAYRVGHGVEDAILILLDKAAKHLDSKILQRNLFMDFSSAFNTVNINTLLRRLEELQHQTLILWINSLYGTIHNMCW